jgi:hypothetical protein
MSRAPGPFTPDGVRWADRPRPRKGPKIPVVKVQPGKTYDFRVLSERIEGVFVHYDGDRTEPCTSDNGECWFPHDVAEPRWQGWLYVWNRLEKKAQLVCLTPGAFEDIEKVATSAATLRGARLQVWRRGKGIRCPLAAELTLSPDLCDSQLPPALDVRALLKLMWNSPLRDPNKEAERRKKYADLADQADGAASPFADADDEIPD